MRLQLTRLAATNTEACRRRCAGLSLSLCSRQRKYQESDEDAKTDAFEMEILEGLVAEKGPDHSFQMSPHANRQRMCVPPHRK